MDNKYKLENYKKTVDDYLSSNDCLEEKEDFLSTELVDLQKVLDGYEEDDEELSSEGEDRANKELFQNALAYSTEALKMLKDGKYLSSMKKNRALCYLMSAIYLSVSGFTTYQVSSFYHVMSQYEDNGIRGAYKTAIFLESLLILLCVCKAKSKFDDGNLYTESIKEYKKELKKGIDLNETKIKH